MLYYVIIYYNILQYIVQNIPAEGSSVDPEEEYPVLSSIGTYSEQTLPIGYEDTDGSSRTMERRDSLSSATPTGIDLDLVLPPDEPDGDIRYSSLSTYTCSLYVCVYIYVYVCMYVCMYMF